jgi:hypothetical protein
LTVTSLGVLHHVRVGEDQAVGADDEARAQAAWAPARCAAGGRADPLLEAAQELGRIVFGSPRSAAEVLRMPLTLMLTTAGPYAR